MKKFKFRLAAVQMQRQIVLDQKIAAKARLVAERDALIAERMQVEAMYHAALTGTPKAGETLDPFVENTRHLRLYALREEIELIQEKIDSYVPRIEAAQLEVQEAHRGLRAMELLEEKDKAAWALEYRRNQQKETDELSVLRFGRGFLK